MSQSATPVTGVSSMPSWVPTSARHYLAHTEAGHSIRALARAKGCHASTVLRQIRRFENLRDDVLVDEALRRLGTSHFSERPAPATLEPDSMTQDRTQPVDEAPSEATLAREARRILRRLCETGAVLAVAADMDKAVIVRDGQAGDATRTAVVDRPIAQAMALKDWISCKSPGRVSRYHITATGRLALNHLLAQAENQALGFAEAPAHFSGAQERAIPRETESMAAINRARRVRYNLAESPLAALARRREKNGAPFLEEELVHAGERLREDFELAQMGPKALQNWDRFLTGAMSVCPVPGAGGESGVQLAHARVVAALRDLGPGLGDAALRCCCYLEGLETAEKRLGWSARSGKIVLRIALQRLKRHYDLLGEAGKLIG